MHTESSNKRWRRLRYAPVAFLAIGVLVAAGGCEYLGLDQSSGGGGANKPKKQKSADEQKDKAQSTDESSGGGSGTQADAEGKSEGDSEKDKEDEESQQKPPSLRESSSESDGQDDENRRVNPFASSPDLETGSDETDEGTTRKQSGPLQRYSYEQYRLAGLLSETAVPKAMFIAPDSVGHVLKKGDRIGKEGGIVQDIRENEVELELPPEGEEGRPRKVTVELRQAEVTEEKEKEELSEEEKKTLQRLLKSEQGREAVREQYKDRSAGGGGRQRQERSQQSGEFQGLEPPQD